MVILCFDWDQISEMMETLNTLSLLIAWANSKLLFYMKCIRTLNVIVRSNKCVCFCFGINFFFYKLNENVGRVDRSCDWEVVRSLLLRRNSVDNFSILYNFRQESWTSFDLTPTNSSLLSSLLKLVFKMAPIIFSSLWLLRFLAMDEYKKTVYIIRIRCFVSLLYCGRGIPLQMLLSSVYLWSIVNYWMLVIVFISKLIT